MANTAPYEIIAGPLDVYFAPTSTPFPGVGVTDAEIKDGGTWTYVGYTEGGVKVSNPQTIVEIRADQVTGIVKAVRSEEGLDITFDLASLTMENYALALNRAIEGPTIAAGQKSVPLYRGGFQVETLALLCRQGHLSPYGDKALQFEVPACFEAGAPDSAFTKDNKAVLASIFRAIVDPNRATDDEAFGRVTAATP
jgi:hypothetical protein